MTGAATTSRKEILRPTCDLSQLQAGLPATSNPATSSRARSSFWKLMKQVSVISLDSPCCEVTNQPIERNKSENDLLRRTVEYSQANERLKGDLAAQAEQIRELQQKLNLPPPDFKHARDCDPRSVHFASEHFPHICASDPRLHVKLNHLATIPQPASRPGLLPSERPRQDWSEGAPPNVCHMGTGGADRFCAKEHTTCPFWHFSDLPQHVYQLGSEEWRRGYDRRERDRKQYLKRREQRAGGKLPICAEPT